MPTLVEAASIASDRKGERKVHSGSARVKKREILILFKFKEEHGIIDVGMYVKMFATTFTIVNTCIRHVFYLHVVLIQKSQEKLMQPLATTNDKRNRNVMRISGIAYR